MCNQEDLEALELFNAKAEELEESSFVKFLRERESGFSISWKRGEPIRIETRWPDEEARDAFVLTLRFFIQNNEWSSFENLESTYDNLPISQQKKELFKNARKKLNEFLDSDSPVEKDGQFLTRREIFDVWLYGDLAHANKKKRVILEEWMSYQPHFGLFIYNEFVHILDSIMSFIRYVHNLNEEVIRELGKMK